jgi:flagellar basal body-associated protein FliL
MSDEKDDINLEDGEDAASPAGGRRAKGLGGALMPILKWVGIGLGALILIFTVAVVAFNVMGGGGKPQTEIPAGNELYEAVDPVYAYSEIRDLPSAYKLKDKYFISIKISLGYDEADKATPTEVTRRMPQILEALLDYFINRTVEDVDQAKRKKVEEELRILLNTKFFLGAIKDINFTKYDITEPQ